MLALAALSDDVFVSTLITILHVCVFSMALVQCQAQQSSQNREKRDEKRRKTTSRHHRKNAVEAESEEAEEDPRSDSEASSRTASFSSRRERKSERIPRRESDKQRNGDKQSSRALFGGLFSQAVKEEPTSDAAAAAGYRIPPPPAAEPNNSFSRKQRYTMKGDIAAQFLSSGAGIQKRCPSVSSSCSLTSSSNDSLEEMSTQALCPATFKEVIRDIDTFIFDADGVLWLAESVIAGSPALVDYLIKLGKQVIVLTNNATKSRAVYAKKLAKLGYNSKLDKNSLVNPSAVMADYLHRAGIVHKKKKVYMIGSKGMRDEMDALGVEYFGHGPEPQDHSDGSAFMFDIELKEKPSNVGAVVIGYEKHFNYHKLMKACNYLRRKECMFIATNEDETCPGPNPDVIIPDAGPIVAAVKCATGREATTMGKPGSAAFDYIQRRWRVNPDRTMMIGDRTNTDVKFGRDHGLRTMLVLSGCHQVDDIVEHQMAGRDDMVPDYYAQCLGALVPPSSARH